MRLPKLSKSVQLLFLLLLFTVSGLFAQTEPTSTGLEDLMFWVKILLGITIILVLNVLRLVFKVRTEEPFANVDFNKLNGRISLAFLIVGMFAAIYYSFDLSDKYLPEAASDHGRIIDNMFNTTLIITGIATIITNVLLFWFAFKYAKKEGQKALYYPDNHKLELLWTVIPAIVLTTLVIYGAKTWTEITAEVPKGAYEIELTGKQFAWNIRYAGLDNKFGPTNFRKISATNEAGFDFEDASSHDDVMPGEIHMPVGKPVHLKIKARDVLHSVFMPHFRVKMDAVPGMPTSFWFTPNTTTKEMRKKLNNPEFNFELACTEVCGRGHFSMKRIIVVETEAEFKVWLAKQKPYYQPPTPASEVPDSLEVKQDTMPKITMVINK